VIFGAAFLAQLRLSGEGLESPPAAYRRRPVLAGMPANVSLLVADEVIE
jgi:hypothetical protein